MKKTFTLCSAFLFGCFSFSVFGQTTVLTQPFSSNIATPSNYPGWDFNTSAGALYWTSTQNNHTINGGTLVFDQPTANGVVNASVTSANETFYHGDVTISFNYDLHGNLSGGSYRKIIISLMDGSGNLTLLDSLILTTPVSGVQTFTTNKFIPSTVQRRLYLYLEGKSAGSTFLLIDNLSAGYAINSLILPVKLASFQGNINKNNNVTLQWQVADNETAGHFEVQRSTNGNEFSTVSMIVPTDVAGTENYQYSETVNTSEKVMYRLKMVDKQQVADYSKILIFQNKVSGKDNPIKLYGNPVNDKLTFSFASTATQTVQVKVYDLTGHLKLNQSTTSHQGVNMISLSLPGSLKPGLYVVELSDKAERYIVKFVKQ